MICLQDSLLLLLLFRSRLIVLRFFSQRSRAPCSSFLPSDETSLQDFCVTIHTRSRQSSPPSKSLPYPPHRVTRFYPFLLFQSRCSSLNVRLNEGILASFYVFSKRKRGEGSRYSGVRVGFLFRYFWRFARVSKRRVETRWRRALIAALVARPYPTWRG